MVYLTFIFFFCDEQVSYLIADKMHGKHPELTRDKYWDDVMPDQLPHAT